MIYESTFKFSMIAAHDDNRVIGSRPGIPWQMPRDKKHFRAYTAGKAMLLGRRTFEEMNGWFTDQRPMVVTRQESYTPTEDYPVAVVESVEAAIHLAQTHDEQELVVAGGAQIYELALPFATDLLITEVHGNFEGDAYFPELPADEWEEVSREHFPADENHSHAMSFVRYFRI